ncbi:MAG: CIA30 family protein [Pseudomonas sp.]|jgi:hypothetical protein|nr:CIA30 family protein [Pseudomonas sp.]MDY0414749.1 CIA30 family protein [Pseudomonas sp.]NLO53879.1 NADH:ubiquinone oxidoreductase complex i intermediate-associated protein 30 [Gammaproteobacteria bacterium]
MHENLTIHGPAIAEEQLIDVYRSTQDQPSPWLVISDQVMGGVSSAELQQNVRYGSNCSCLVGRTRLDNNGGFVQMKLDIPPSELHTDYRGVFIELCGTAHDYNLHVKTTQLTRPWQSFRCSLAVQPQWTRFILPYEQLQAHRTEAELQPATIRSIAVVAIGQAFDVDVCVRRFGFFR